MGKEYAIINGAGRQIKKKHVIVNGAGRKIKRENAIVNGAGRNIFVSEATITLTNRATGNLSAVWSDAGDLSSNVLIGSAPSRRCYVRGNLHLWAFDYNGGNAYCNFSGLGMSAGCSGWASPGAPHTATQAVIYGGGGELRAVGRRYGSAQGHMWSDGCMIVDISQIESELGYQLTPAQAYNLFGYFTGSKTITIQL